MRALQSSKLGNFGVTPEEDQEEIQETTVSLAAANATSMDAAVVTLLL